MQAFAGDSFPVRRSNVLYPIGPIIARYGTLAKWFLAEGNPLLLRKKNGYSFRSEPAASAGEKRTKT